MKKFSRAHLVASAAALALTVPAVHAGDSSVSISGMLDLGTYRDAAKKWNLGSIQRSNIAFGASTDLGQGMSAIAKLSHRFNPDDGTQESASKPFWHGEATLGLKAPFGTIQAGRRLDATNSQDWQFDPWYNFDRVASPAWDTWHYNYASDPKGNSGTAEYGRLNNGIFYDSPQFGGFTVHLSTSPEKADTDKTRPLGVSLNYNAEKYAAMLARSKNSADATDTFVGGRLNLAPVAVMAAYNESKAGASKAKTMTAGLEYGIGATTLKAGVGRVNLDGETAVRVLGAGASYAWNDRTTVYTDVSRKKFGTDSATLFGVGASYSF